LSDPVEHILRTVRVDGRETLVDVIVTDQGNIDTEVEQRFPERAGTHLVVAVRARRDERMMHVRKGARTRMVLQEVPEPQELRATTPASHVYAVRVERDQPPRPQSHGVPAARVRTGAPAEVGEVAEGSVVAVVLMIPGH